MRLYMRFLGSLTAVGVLCREPQHQKNSTRCTVILAKTIIGAGGDTDPSRNSFSDSLRFSLVNFTFSRRGSPSTDRRASRLASGPCLLASRCLCDVRILGHTRQVHLHHTEPISRCAAKFNCISRASIAGLSERHPALRIPVLPVQHWVYGSQYFSKSQSSCLQLVRTNAVARCAWDAACKTVNDILEVQAFYSYSCCALYSRLYSH